MSTVHYIAINYNGLAGTSVVVTDCYLLAVGDAGNMQNVFESANAAFGNREIDRSLDKTSDCREKLSETGNGASSSSSTVFRASALAGVFNSLFVRKNVGSHVGVGKTVIGYVLLLYVRCCVFCVVGAVRRQRDTD